MLYVLPVKHTQLYIRQDSSLSVVNGLPAGQLRNSGFFPGRDERFRLFRNVQTGCFYNNEVYYFLGMYATSP